MLSCCVFDAGRRDRQTLVLHVYNRHGYQKWPLLPSIVKSFASVFCLLISASVLPADEPRRQWSDLSGKFSISAQLQSRTATNVVLEKADGQTVTVPIERLSGSDREYLSRLKTSANDNDAGAASPLPASTLSRNEVAPMLPGGWQASFAVVA